MDDIFTIDSIDDLINAFGCFSWTKEDIDKLRDAIDRCDSDKQEKLTDGLGPKDIDVLADFLTTALIDTANKGNEAKTQADAKYWDGKHKAYWDVQHWLGELLSWKEILQEED